MKKREYFKICKILYQDDKNSLTHDTFKTNKRKARYLNNLITNELTPQSNITPRPATTSV